MSTERKPCSACGHWVTAVTSTGRCVSCASAGRYALTGTTERPEVVRPSTGHTATDPVTAGEVAAALGGVAVTLVATIGAIVIGFFRIVAPFMLLAFILGMLGVFK